jgi:hypothetical protein
MLRARAFSEADVNSEAVTPRYLSAKETKADLSDKDEEDEDGCENKHDEEDDDSDEEEEKHETKPKKKKCSSDENEDEEDYSDFSETSSSHDRREILETHDQMFALQNDYTFVCQITKSSYAVYAVQDRLSNWVVKINKNRNKGIPREVVCMSRCVGLPYVAQLHRWHKMENGYYALVTPEYEDDPLELVYESPAKIQSYMRQLFTALLGCLRVRVFHRDVKPGNVYYGAESNSLVLADFDSSVTDPDKLRKFTHVGTSGYTAPELSNGTGYDWKADVYSCGVIFGQLLYHVNSEMDVDNQLVSAWRKPKGKSRKPQPYKFHGDKDAQDLLWKLLEKSPKKRLGYEEALNHKYFQQKYA